MSEQRESVDAELLAEVQRVRKATESLALIARVSVMVLLVVGSIVFVVVVANLAGG